MTEENLVKYCQQEDRKSQEILFHRYSDRLYRVAQRYVGTADAEDCLIIAFTKAFRAIADFQYKGSGSLEGWLRRIVVNESLMWLRKNHNFSLTTEGIEGNEDPLVELADLEAEEILNIINRLPTGYRTVLNLNLVEGYSHEEIGLQLGITESTSRSQLSKARAMVQKILLSRGYQYGT